MSYNNNSGPGSIAGSSDVLLNGPADQQVLTYVAADSKWSNLSPQQLVTTPESYGAYGDGSHDDTTAIQNALNYIVQNNGTLWFTPGKTYKISSPLIVGTTTYQSNYHVLINDATLLQATDNTAILHFTKTGHRRVSITGGHFKWANVQAASNTNSIAIFFDSDTSSDDGFFNFKIDECYFERGFRGISNTNDSGPIPGGSLNKCPVWGGRITNLRSGNDMSGAQVCIVQGGVRNDTSSSAPSSGSPNNYVANCHHFGAALTEAAWIFAQADLLTLQNIEMNQFNKNGTNTVTTELYLGSVDSVNIIGIRTELGVHTKPGDAIWSFGDARVRVNGATVATCFFTFANAGTGYLFRNTGGHYSKINICDVVIGHGTDSNGNHGINTTNATVYGIQGPGTNDGNPLYTEWRFYGYWYDQDNLIGNNKVSPDTSSYVIGSY